MSFSVVLHSKKNPLPSPMVNQGQSLETTWIWKLWQSNAQDKQWQYSLHWQLAGARGMDFATDSLILYREPRNELQQLCKRLCNYLHSPQPKSHHFRFEPIEPNFELLIEPSKGSDASEYKLYLWVDNGNLLSADSAYTWDAVGLRLYCTRDDLLTWLDSLQEITATA